MSVITRRLFHRSLSFTKFSDSFSINTLQVLKCTVAGHTRSQKLPFPSKLLTIALDSSLNQLVDLIKEFSRPESIPVFPCGSCKKECEHIQQVLLANPPPRILAITLLRLLDDLKNTDPVYIPEILEVDFTNENGELQRCRFKLFAVILHSGTLFRGHYTSLVRYPSSTPNSDNWFYCNDSTVTTSSLDIISKGNYGDFTPYLIFYVNETIL